MANIEKELKAIMEAEYGEEVRSSIHDAIKAGNDEIVTYGFKEEERSQAEADRVAAENARAAAEVLREEAKAAAEAAAEAAGEAAERANEAAIGGVSKMIVNFEESETLEPPESGETIGILFGKVKKWLESLSSGAGSTLLEHLFSPGKVLVSGEGGEIVESNVSVVDLASLSGTTGNLQEQITQLNDSILLRAYPVGSIYISTAEVNPETLFGGAWEAWGSGRVPVGVDASDPNFNEIEKAGGTALHTHTTGNVTLKTTQIPSHTHTLGGHTHGIPALGGSTNATGGHTHKISDSAIYRAEGNNAGAPVLVNSSGQNMFGTVTAGDHSHTVTTNASTTGGPSANSGAAGGGQAHNHGATGSANNLPPYITCYMWKRVA